MTNFEKIKSMSLDMMTNFFYNVDNDTILDEVCRACSSTCGGCSVDTVDKCRFHKKEMIEIWLSLEAKDDPNEELKRALGEIRNLLREARIVDDKLDRRVVDISTIDEILSNYI